MSFVDAIILGLIQGLTEFIPVSSSGHLVFFNEFFSLESSFEFDLMLNIGTLLALLIYFRFRIRDLVLRMKDNRPLLFAVTISTIPAVVVGGLFTDFFERDSVRSLYVVAFMLFSIGIVMLLLERLRVGDKAIEKVTPRDALMIGLAQALALIPGTSRSGSTIVAGRLMGLRFSEAAEYSFLIAIPIVAGALLRSLFEPETADLLQSDFGLLIAGVLSSFVSGLFAIRFMLRFLKNHGLSFFGWYRIFLAGVVLLIAIN
jgi:undecaprenyl-diphosphatase